jgi:hypothetical protein
MSMIKLQRLLGRRSSGNHRRDHGGSVRWTDSTLGGVDGMAELGMRANGLLAYGNATQPHSSIVATRFRTLR